MKEEAVDHLVGQLQKVKDRAAIELASQWSSFIAAAQQHEIASREVTNVAVAKATADIQAEYEAKISQLKEMELCQHQAVQQQILRLQHEAETAKAYARQAEENERLSREQAQRQDAALKSAFEREREVQTQREATLLLPQTAPDSFHPVSRNYDMGSQQVHQDGQGDTSVSAMYHSRRTSFRVCTVH